MGLRQIALCVLLVSGFQLTNAKAIVLPSADSAPNTPDSRTGLPLNHIGIVNNGPVFSRDPNVGVFAQSLVVPVVSI